jgi:hypothetical protein
MQRKIEWKCPYCGHVHSCWKPVEDSAEVAYCDSEDGGCDRRVVLDIRASLTVRVSRIEEDSDD